MIMSGQLHKVNLAFRFFLELVMFASLAAAPATALDGGGRWIWAIIAPITAMTLWGVFATPDDPSRSGKTMCFEIRAG